MVDHEFFFVKNSMLILRGIQKHLSEDVMGSGKIVLLYGPRQAGKTTLSKMMIEETGLKC